MLRTTNNNSRNQSKGGFVSMPSAIFISTIVIIVGYFSLQQNNLKSTPVANASTVVSVITDAEARSQLQTANICNYPDGWDKIDCVNDKEPKTSLSGVQQAVLTEIINFKKACDVWSGNGGVCNVGVTGGTETTGGHRKGACGHLTGDKIDIDNTDTVNSYILAKDSLGEYVNFISSGSRRDGTALFKNKATGVIYAKEATHWDVGGIGCTK